MKQLCIPTDYSPILDIWETERAILIVKEFFQTFLASELKLRRITAPLVITSGTGLNDDLSGSEHPVRFPVAALNGANVEIVQSLAKWKRFALWRHQIESGLGIYTDMNALRPDETVDNIHSLYVDQWDWEKVISRNDRTEEVLHRTVKKIYAAIQHCEFILTETFPQLCPFLPESIHIIHAEELLQRYPTLTPKERENEIAKTYGAVFIQGIGAPLSNGIPHDNRSADYDDWYTETSEQRRGLNGDIIVWNPVLQSALELSSMGIRVDSFTLKKQLMLTNTTQRSELLFHRLLLQEQLPQTMGGGIGQSRLCMLLLQKCHIGEVQAGVWPQDVIDICQSKNVFLL